MSSLQTSILIVNFRSYPELRACLESLQRFSGPDVEVVIVDHSSDADAARDLRLRFPHVHLLAVDTNPGFAAGVNRAAAVARGRFLLLVNPDCLVDDDVARVLASWMDEHPDVGVCGALVREIDGSVQPSARRFPTVVTGFAGRTSWLRKVWPGNPWTARDQPIADRPEQPMAVDWVSGACMMIRRSAFDAAGGLDEQFFMYWEDADLCFRLRLMGWTTYYCPLAGVTHLTSRSSAHVPSESLVAFHRSAFRYFRKHGGSFAKLAAPVVFLALQVRVGVRLMLLRLRRRSAPPH